MNKKSALPVRIDIGAGEQGAALLLDLDHVSKQEEIDGTDLGVDVLAQARIPCIRRYRAGEGQVLDTVCEPGV